MEINFATSGPSDLFYQVNNDVPTAVKVGRGQLQPSVKHDRSSQDGCWIQLVSVRQSQGNRS